MTDQYSMFGLTTSEATTSATSSQASEDGATLSDSPDGQMTGQSGQDHVLVSRFRARDSKKAMRTNDTSGPLFTASSPSASLQRSLENRLDQNLDLNGSLEFALIWKAVDMPAGPPIYRLRASGRRTSGKDYGGWATPTASGNPPRSPEFVKGCDSLSPEEALPAGWPTTSANDHMPQSPLPEHLNAYMGQPSPRMKEAGWPTPVTDECGESSRMTGYLMGKPVPPSEQYKTAGWPTPTARDWKDTRETTQKLRDQYTQNTEANRPTTLGLQASLSPAPTEKRGALNPEFSLWLMGYPTEWARCAERVTRSSRKSRQSS